MLVFSQNSWVPTVNFDVNKYEMMSVPAYLRFVLILFIFCVNFQPSAQDASQFTEKQGLPGRERHLFQQATKLLQRSRRQAANGDPSLDLPPGDFPQPAVCGINGKSKNLIKEADPSPGIDWPWIVGFVSKDMNPPEAFCGGSLLNRKYVLTAAHCFEKQTADGIFVRMGEYNFETTNDTHFVDHQVEKIISHEQYDSPLHKNDIALVKLKGEVQYSQYIRPICLPPADYQIKVNQTATVAGWGQMNFGETNSLVLLQVSIPVWNLNFCQQAYGPKVFDHNICAAGYEGNKDSCVGDSGGPLISQLLPGGRWIQLGVVSWGAYCGDAEKAGVYTSVIHFLDWIQNRMPDAVF